MTGLSWLSIFRMGLVQTALGAMVVLTTSTMNRVMTVELALAATVPGALLALHHAVQLARPRWGYSSDMGSRRTPWIIGGLAILGFGVVLAAASTALMGVELIYGVVLAIVAYVLIGIGVGAAGTSLLAMLASKVAPARRAPAATIVWLMMIAGFIVTSIFAGINLDPFTPTRLVVVTSVVVIVAFVVAVFAIWGVEASVVEAEPKPDDEDKPSFMEALREIRSEPKVWAFTVFVFISMFAYATQDLILEPFAGIVFGMTPGESTKLTGHQNSGVFIGMILVAFLAAGKRPRFGSVRAWTVGGCVASGLVLMLLMVSGYVPGWPIRLNVAALGLANGAFAAAAIAWMMGLAGEGRASREGMRMGLWGGAQAIGFALGGFLGTVGVDVVRYVFDSRVLSYAAVFGAEGALFFLSALLAARMQLAKPLPVSAPRPSPDTASIGAAELTA